ncbi:hypothetical protein [Neptunomonas concharum]|uniref:Uncharacterized protein n=1 Tax=Neptunomonas concharum TaxID=1031538 RepID=A0A5P1R7J3_9GAMM|nr:hypothetical protein [Neptunomonas concharum]QEQ95568.1 hypothetical protein F0U83_01970 [Neptunomonas concharum]
MENHHLSAQLKQLLKRGYSIEDVKNLVTAPRAIVDQAILEFQLEQQTARQLEASQQNQARYAMGLGSNR